MKFTYYPFAEAMPKEWENIKEYYGFTDFPADQLLKSSEGDKIISYVSPAIRDYLKYDTKGVINKVNLGYFFYL